MSEKDVKKESKDEKSSKKRTLEHTEKTEEKEERKTLKVDEPTNISKEQKEETNLEDNINLIEKVS